MEMKQREEDISEALSLYVRTGGTDASVTALPGSGSDRRYYRITDNSGSSVIATCGDDREENRVFCGLAQVFREQGCRVPAILGEDPEHRVYLQQDLGSTDLLSLLKGERRLELATEALKALVGIQTVPEEVWSEKVMWAPFSRRLVMWDLNYFKYDFLKPVSIAMDEDRLEDDFEVLARDLCACDERMLGFMYRDFQSRNIMVKEDALYFIDFQGGRKGPLLYDAVSFLWQAKAAFTTEEREKLMGVYADELSVKRGIERSEVLEAVDKFALFRTLQVLGAYGFRGLVEKKAHFIESIPGALQNLAQLLDKGVLRPYPELSRVAERCCASRFSGKSNSEGLTVKVFSFSYKRGYPEDLSGNGGGFMFDCRGMHNPGRYERYKPLTGMDREVIDFLEERGEVQKFVESASDIVSPAVARYLERGFNSLQVGFGCTGGRHRSVYCAEHFAEEIKRRFPEADVILCHREQGIERRIGR